MIKVLHNFDKNIIDFSILNSETLVLLDNGLNLFSYNFLNKSTIHHTKLEKKPTTIFTKDKKIYLGMQSGHIFVHFLSENLVQDLYEHTEPIFHLNDQNDTYLVSSSNDKTLKIWDSKGACKSTYKLSKPFKFERIINTHFGQSGRILALYSPNSPNIELFNLTDNEVFRVLKHSSNVKCIAQSNDGCIISGLENGEIYQWDLYKSDCELIGKSNSEIKYLYNGAKLVSLSSEVCVWDLYTFSQIEKFSQTKNPEKMLMDGDYGFVLEKGNLVILNFNFPEKKKIEGLEFQSEENGDSFGFFISSGTMDSLINLCFTSRLYTNMFLSNLLFYFTPEALLDKLKELEDERSMQFLKIMFSNHFPKVWNDSIQSDYLDWINKKFPSHSKEIKEIIEVKKVPQQFKVYQKTYKFGSFLEISDQDFCDQLTLINQDFQSDLNLEDIIYKDFWTKKKLNQQLCYSYERIFSQNECITCFVIHTILFSKSLNESLEVWQKWINILLILKKMKNFEALLAIYYGLNITCVHRLKKISSKISKYHADSFKQIEQFINVPDGYTSFNKEMLKSEPPSIPSAYVVYYYSVRFVQDQSGAYLNHQHTKVNWTRIRSLYLAVSRLNPYQKTKYPIVKSKSFLR